MTDKDLTLIPRRKFRELQGNVSLMTIYRREKAIPKYPKPVTIRGRAFYYWTDVESYLESLRDDGGAQ
jgi:hypothetical protein